MHEEDPDDPMPDRMNKWTAISGFAIAGAIIFVMFYWALPATVLN
jgi:hypothetical protein